MKYAVVYTNGNLAYVANGKPVGLPDCYAGAVPLSDPSDPEPRFLSRSFACSMCGGNAEDEKGKIGTVREQCSDHLCYRGPASHSHVIMALCVACGDKRTATSER